MWSPAFASYIFKICVAIIKDKAKRLLKSCPLTGKINPRAEQLNLEGEIEPKRLNAEYKYLWGKNYIPNSEIKFEYCSGGVHCSYPDFVMKDCYDRIHIFEVKSLNKSNAVSNSFDGGEYEEKIEELKKVIDRLHY